MKNSRKIRSTRERRRRRKSILPLRRRVIKIKIEVLFRFTSLLSEDDDLFVVERPDDNPVKVIPN